MQRWHTVRHAVYVDVRLKPTRELYYTDKSYAILSRHKCIEPPTIKDSRLGANVFVPTVSLFCGRNAAVIPAYVIASLSTAPGALA